MTFSFTCLDCECFSVAGYEMLLCTRCGSVHGIKGVTKTNEIELGKQKSNKPRLSAADLIMLREMRIKL